jgi:hypothetical protein
VKKPSYYTPAGAPKHGKKVARGREAIAPLTRQYADLHFAISRAFRDMSAEEVAAVEKAVRYFDNRNCSWTELGLVGMDSFKETLAAARKNGVKA